MKHGQAPREPGMLSSCTRLPPPDTLHPAGKHNYSTPLAAWLRHFPAEQVHLIQMEELVSRGHSAPQLGRRAPAILALQATESGAQAAQRSAPDFV